MTVTIPSELQQAVSERAAQRQVTTEEIVREALTWYLQFDEALLDELSAWQKVRDESLELVEGSHLETTC